MDITHKTIANNQSDVAVEQQADLQLKIKQLTKALKLQTFLAEKYKRDIEIMNEFFKTNIADAQRKNEELLNVNLKLEKFAYVVAHDLKAPLRTISSFSNLLKAHFDNNKTPETAEFVDFIMQASDQMSNLVSDTLEYSRVKDDKIRIKTVDLNIVLSQIINVTLANKVDTIIDFDCDVLPEIQANQAMMHKLFLNLIQNGLKYNKSEHKKISITYTDSSTHYIFHVKDNGIGLVGLAGKGHEAIFEMFTRLHNSSEYEGTGIGLAMCKKIVDNHNGEISVTSKKNEGCIFTCTISKSLNSQKEKI